MELEADRPVKDLMPGTSGTGSQYYQLETVLQTAEVHQQYPSNQQISSQCNQQESYQSQQRQGQIFQTLGKGDQTTMYSGIVNVHLQPQQSQQRQVNFNNGATFTGRPMLPMFHGGLSTSSINAQEFGQDALSNNSGPNGMFHLQDQQQQPQQQLPLSISEPNPGPSAFLPQQLATVSTTTEGRRGRRRSSQQNTLESHAITAAREEPAGTSPTHGVSSTESKSINY